MQLLSGRILTSSTRAIPYQQELQLVSSLVRQKLKEKQKKKIKKTPPVTKKLLRWNSRIRGQTSSFWKHMEKK